MLRLPFNPRQPRRWNLSVHLWATAMLALFGCTAYADGDSTRPVSGLASIYVEADEFYVDLVTEQAFWRGDVEAVQGNYTFRSGSLTIQLDQIGSQTEPGASQSSTQPLSASGYELSADSLSYDPISDQIIGEGNCELRRGIELIRADQIVYRAVEQTARAIARDNGRVQVQFVTDPQQPLFPAGALAQTGI